MHEEPVALRLGQGVDALGLDRVLRGEHEERRGSARVSPPIDTCRSPIASSSADWTLAGARLISSASTMFANSGPHSISKLSCDGRQMRVPTRSAGTRSGVNCTRAKCPPTACAIVDTVSVLARPGKPSIRQCPSASRHTMTRSTRRSWPTTTFLTWNSASASSAAWSAPGTVEARWPVARGPGPVLVMVGSKLSLGKLGQPTGPAPRRTLALWVLPDVGPRDLTVSPGRCAAGGVQGVGRGHGAAADRGEHVTLLDAGPFRRRPGATPATGPRPWPHPAPGCRERPGHRGTRCHRCGPCSRTARR